MSKKIEFLANVAIVVVSLLCGAILVQKHLLHQTTRSGSEDIKVGKKIALDRIEVATGHSLVLVLSQKCHFCTESASFYRRLVVETRGKNVHLIAVLAQPVAEGRDYLKSLDITIDDVRQVSPGALKVRGTPTLILTDKAGVVTRIWRGKLSREREADVMDSLRSEPQAAAPECCPTVYAC